MDWAPAWSPDGRFLYFASDRGFTDKLAIVARVPLVGGTPEVVCDGETGFLVRSDDANAMAERIGHLLCNEKLRTQFGQAGREKMEREYSFESQANQYCQLFESLVSRKRVAA